MLEEYFDKIYLINLEHRKDKLKHCLDMFKKLNIENYHHIKPILPKQIPFRFKKIKPTEISCYLSHLSCYRDAQERNLNKILIFEDDFCFNEKIKNDFIRHINKCIFFLKRNNWDLFYFDNIKTLKKDKNNITTKFIRYDIDEKNPFMEIEGKYLTHSYAINKKLMDYFLEKYQLGFDIPVDNILKRGINNKIFKKIIYSIGVFDQLMGIKTDINRS